MAAGNDALDEFLADEGDGRSNSSVWQWPKVVAAVEKFLKARAAGKTQKSVREFHRWLRSAAGTHVEKDFNVGYDAMRNFMERNYADLYEKVKGR